MTGRIYEAGSTGLPSTIHDIQSSSSSCVSSSSSSSASSSSSDDDSPYEERPLPPWLLQDLAAQDLTGDDARSHSGSANSGTCASSRIGDNDEVTHVSNTSSHTEVSIEIASVDDSTDASLLSLRSAASLEDFSDGSEPLSSGGSVAGGVAVLQQTAMREMNEMRWSAMRQQAHAQYNTGSELHRQGRVSEAVQTLKAALESARQAHDTTLEALVLSRLGLICNRGGKHSKAVSLFKATLRTVARSTCAEAAAAESRSTSSARRERDESAETTTCLLALQGLTQAYMKLGQPQQAAASERQALDLLPRANLTASTAAHRGVGGGEANPDPGEVRRRMANIVRRRLAEAQAAIPVVCRGLLPLAATRPPSTPAAATQAPASPAPLPHPSPLQSQAATGAGGWEGDDRDGWEGRRKIGSGAKCVTLLQEALDIAMQVEDLALEGTGLVCSQLGAA